jgi:hypothetical protein
MDPFISYSVLLWDIVEPAGFVIIMYLLYRIYKEIKLLREMLEERSRQH